RPEEVGGSIGAVQPVARGHSGPQGLGTMQTQALRSALGCVQRLLRISYSLDAGGPRNGHAQL
ncbi:MAG: hypothetical protein VW518_10710, partial [Burkholderiaceae bacterium]